MTTVPAMPAAPVLDPRALPPDLRFSIAETVRTSYDIELPWMSGWNDRPCLRHQQDGGVPVASCLRCGVRPRRHQRVGATWMFFAFRAGLFDSTGLGKTIQCAALLALMRETGELGPGTRRALIIARAATIGQWRDQLARMVPDLPVACVTGSQVQRARALGGEWEAALCGPEMMVSKASHAINQLLQFDFGTVICDDIEALKNVNKTSRTIRLLTDKADRVVIATATPLDKRLTQLYDTGRLLGWQSVFGTGEEFQHRYVQMEQTWYTPRLKPVVCKWCKTTMIADHAEKMWVTAEAKKARVPDGPCPSRPGQPHLPLSRVEPGPRFQWIEKGVNPERLAEFRARLAPLAIRRTAADCDDVEMPDAEIGQVWLELGAQQKKRYDELRRGILTRLDDRGKPVSKREADALWLRAWQVTSSLANLDSSRTGESVKLEWVTEALTGDLGAEATVVYCYFRATLADLAGRLTKAGVPNVRIWGEQHASEQDSAIRSFNAGAARVMLITDAGGMGLNLQRARRLIMVDTPRSVGRCVQIIGRIKRDSSAHQTVYVTQLFSQTPLERALQQMIGREALMSAQVLGSADGEAALLLEDQPEQLLRMVTG